MATGYLIAIAALAGTDGQNQPGPPIDPPAGVLGDLSVTYGAITATRGARSPAALAGYVVRDWQDDYLDRIIIQIDNPAFGIVAGVVERTLTIWNRYRSARSVTAQDAVGASGVEIVGWPALPFGLPQSSERSWPLQATAEGDPVITGYLTFAIGGEELQSVELSGVRAIVFPHRPNWRDAIEVGRGYADTIDEAISLAEERKSFGDVALVDVRFTVLALDSDEASSLARTFEKTRALPVGMPLWTEGVRTTTTAAVGATSLAVTNTSQRKFTTARPFVLLWQDWQTWAIAEISDVAESTIALAAGLLAEWPTGTLVLPVRFGKIALGADQRLVTDRVREVGVDFEEVPL